MAHDLLIAWMDVGDHQPLLQASNAAAADSLCRLLDEQESHYPDFDVDRLAKAGNALLLAEKWDAPAAAIAWLKRSPSQARLDLVLSVLLVSWNPGRDERPPEPRLVEELLASYDALPYDMLSENGLLLVLIPGLKAGFPPTLTARLRSWIERAHADPERHANIRAELEKFLSSTAPRIC